eukprot:jgi/Ulvmu1/6523/UM003_0156.1
MDPKAPGTTAIAGQRQWRDYLAQQCDSSSSSFLRMPTALTPGEDSSVRVMVRHQGSLSHRVTLFSTNDYLGLSAHPHVRQAVAEAATVFGMGPRTAPLVSGHTTLHARLEREIANLKHAETCLLFPTGFAACIAAVSSLAADNRAAVFSDALNHASLIDGCRLAARRGAQTFIFRHMDYQHLEELLEEHKDVPNKLVLTDGVFSMDGYTADMAELNRLKAKHGFLLAVDDAHGTLVVGQSGGGVSDLNGGDCVDVHIGTLSKAIGCHGGFIACTEEIKMLLVNFGRTYIFSTALPAPTVAGALAALEVIRNEPWRTERLRELQGIVSKHLKQDVNTPIVRIIIGSVDESVRLSAALWAKGFHVPAIQPPIVPNGTSRLRVSLSAEHTPDEVMSVLKCLDELGLRATMEKEIPKITMAATPM